MTRFIGLVSAVLLSIAQPARAATEADVIVYGATPGGVCAAIAAAVKGRLSFSWSRPTTWVP